MQRDRLFVTEMVSAAQRAISLFDELDGDDLQTDQVRREAVLWNIMVLGEAAAQVSDDTKNLHSEIPWHLPTSLRNRIIHGHWAIDLDVITSTVQDDLPILVRQLGRVLIELSG